MTVHHNILTVAAVWIGDIDVTDDFKTLPHRAPATPATIAL